MSDDTSQRSGTHQPWKIIEDNQTLGWGKLVCHAEIREFIDIAFLLMSLIFSCKKDTNKRVYLDLQYDWWPN